MIDVVDGVLFIYIDYPLSDFVKIRSLTVTRTSFKKKIICLVVMHK